MKTEKTSRIVFAAIVAVTALSSCRAGLSQSVTPNSNMPADTRQYVPPTVDLGELGRQDRYERPKQFWGDDPISQGGQSITDKIGRGIDQYRKNLNLGSNQSQK